jgi:hypothetical protein
MAQLTAVAVAAAPDDGVRNSQPEGIGRVAALGDMVCWNNLGRNVVFADRQFRPHAVFGTTLFAGEDEPSQYDLDIHAVLDLPGLRLVAVLNHLGTVRCFRRADLLGRSPRRADGALRMVEPTTLWSFAADVERTVVASGRLVGSRPRSEGAEGLLVSAPLSSIAADACVPLQLCAQECGEVTALGVVPSTYSPLIAVGGNGRLGLAPLVGDGLAPMQWATDVGFRVACIAWHRGVVWAAGPERTATGAGTVNDHDWDRLEGGRFAALDPSDGSVLVCGSLPQDVAWGTGGVAVAPVGRMLAAAGRTGGLHLIDPRGRAADRATAPLAESSLGIAHMAVVGRRLLFGFNRGGYRLHSFSQPPAGGAGLRHRA